MLGDVQSGYDYNALLYKLDLSPLALYGKYLVFGVAGIALAWVWLSGGKRR